MAGSILLTVEHRQHPEQGLVLAQVTVSAVQGVILLTGNAHRISLMGNLNSLFVLLFGVGLGLSI